MVLKQTATFSNTGCPFCKISLRNKKTTKILWAKCANLPYSLHSSRSSSSAKHHPQVYIQEQLIFSSSNELIYCDVLAMMNSIAELFCKEGLFSWLDFEQLSLSPENELKVKLLFTTTFLSKLD